MLVHTVAVWEWDTYSLCKDGVDDTVDGAMKPKQPIVHLMHTTGRRVCQHIAMVACCHAAWLCTSSRLDARRRYSRSCVLMANSYTDSVAALPGAAVVACTKKPKCGKCVCSVLVEAG